MAFNLPVQNYFRRTDGPAVYSRPACWPVITDVATEVQFLFCDLEDASCSIRTNFTRTSGSQNITIDWGDGFSNVISSTNTTNTIHTYTPGTGTPCPSLGYTTFIIRVYFTGTGVSVLSNCNIMANPISGNNNSLQVCNVLEAYYGDSTQNVTPVNFYSVTGNSSTLSFYSILQFVKLPATVSWTSWNTTFSGCELLIKVVMPTSNSAATSYTSAFAGCNSLLEITLPSNSTGITSLQLSFDGCNNLRSVTLPSTLNFSNFFVQTFRNCINLRSLTVPSIINTCCFNLCFENCTQLEWVKFTSMPTVTGSVNFESAFLNCFNLQNVYFPATGTVTSIYNFNQTFSGCNQLKTITLPSNINVSIFSSTFNNCYALTTCILPTSSPSGTTYSSTFNNCFSLLKITLPAAPTANVPFISTFSNCYKLQEITIPSGYVFTNMISICNNCYSLKTFTWTPGTQNSLTSLGNAFNNCYILTSITMPTSMTIVSNMATVFTNCYMLTSVTLPSTLNAVSNMQLTFQNCRSLTSVTLPTSMSACTNFNGTFTGCKIISSITLPNTVSSTVSNFASCFTNCFSLKTCVLPGAAQLSSVSTIDGMFQYCSNLVTLTNFNKIGSLTATPLITAVSFNGNRFTGGSAISFSGPMSRIQLQGLTSTIRTNVQSVRLLNTSAGQWTGSSPQIDISNTNMSTAQIVQLFNDMAAQPAVSGKTINITSATGAAGLTLANRQIIISRGWTITG
jgi:hypothetical protein